MPVTMASGVEGPLVLTIDIGSSSVRTMLFDVYGHAVAQFGVREAYELHAGPDGTSVDDPDAALERVFRCIDELLADAGPLAGAIGAVAIDTLVSNFIAIDDNGRPLTPLIGYADTRNDADAAHLRQTLDEPLIHQRTGCLLRTSYWPARLAWLKRTQPDIWRMAARFITLGEYLELRLFGTCRAGLSPASWTGMLDRTRLVWDTPLLDDLGVEQKQFSPLANTSDPIHGLREPFGSRWPTLRDVPWFPAIGDGAAANIGSGCASPDRVALTVGTTGALRIVRNIVADVPAGLWCYRVDAQRALVGGATSEGGNVYAWLRRTLQLPEPQEVEQSLTHMLPDAHGLTILPLWAGERSPGWAGNAKASITGMTMATTPIEILRASLEGVAYRFALIAERLLAGTEQAQIVVSGGGLHQSAAWTQIVADVLGRALILSQEPEATSRGAALLALEAIGAITDVATLPANDGAIIMPNLEHYAVYQGAIERQRQLYDLLIG